MSIQDSLMSTAKVQLTVPSNYALDPWFKIASPEEVGVVLDLAGRLQRIVGDEKNEMASRLYAARNEGTAKAIKQVLAEATQLEQSRAGAEIQQLRARMKEMEGAFADLHSTNNKQGFELVAAAEQIKLCQAQMDSKQQELALRHDNDIATLKHQFERELKEKEHTLNLELARIKTHEDHLEQTHAIKLESVKRETTVSSSEHYQILKDEYNAVKNSHDQLKSDVEVRIAAARQQEAHSAEEHARREREQSTAAYNAIQAEKLKSDNRLLESATEKLKLSEELNLMSVERVKEVAKLKETISQLNNPLTRGNCGEFDIAQTLHEAGFHVVDTSTGDRKTEGYLDLLVTQDSGASDNMRLAIEVKNKKTIKKASDEKVFKAEKDTDDDIKTFQQRVAHGVKAGLFDAAMLISIRAHTKMGAPVVLEMFDDATNRALAPVSYIGPEKSKRIIPLTQDQVETQTQMMFCVLNQCHAIRRDLCNGLKDEEVASFQSLFQEMGDTLNKTFVDLRKQEQLIQELSNNLTAVRFKCVRMFRSIYNLNGRIPWLKRRIDCDWIGVFDTAKERANSMNEGEVWNRVCKQKATIENSIGKDAMFMAIRHERQVGEQGGFEHRKAPERRAEASESGSASRSVEGNGEGVQNTTDPQATATAPDACSKRPATPKPKRQRSVVKKVGQDKPAAKL